jgi:hypothetical protein
MPRKQTQMTRRPQPAPAAPEQPAVPVRVKQEIERLLRVAESDGGIDWETSCRLRLGEMVEPCHYLTGYLAAVCDCLGVRVDDLLGVVREPDGSPVMKRERSLRSDQLADALGMGARAGIAWWCQTPLDVIGAWEALYRVSVPSVRERCLPIGVEDEIATLVADGNLPNDPEAIGNYRKGWLHSILWEFPQDSSPRPSKPLPLRGATSPSV